MHTILKTIYILAWQVPEYHNIFCYTENMFTYIVSLIILITVKVLFLLVFIFFSVISVKDRHSMDIIEEYVHNFQLSNNLVGLQ